MAGFRANVIGFKDLSQSLKDVLHTLSPPETAELMAIGGEVIAEGVRDNIRRQGLVESGHLLETVSVYKINQFASGVRVSAVYAAVHEFGYTGVITARQRAFFWAMWYETKEDMWKALALSRTYTIPQRSYFRPAVDEQRGRAIRAIAGEARERVEMAAAQ